ncbi:hypothetical protein PVAP13_3KG234727, partial [Panicum virgatum]
AVYHFGFVAICLAIWKCRNRVCFDKKLIKHPSKIMFHACSFMTYWVGLYNSELQGTLMVGVKAQLASSAGMCSARNNPSNASRILTAAMDGEKTDEEDD